MVAAQEDAIFEFPIIWRQEGKTYFGTVEPKQKNFTL